MISFISVESIESPDTRVMDGLSETYQRLGDSNVIQQALRLNDLAWLLLQSNQPALPS